jgi:hypothetical protein
MAETLPIVTPELPTSLPAEAATIVRVDQRASNADAIVGT